MTKDDRPNRKVKDNGNTKSKNNDASPAPITGSPDASGLRRSSRETSSRKQATASPSNPQKSEQIEKQTSPNPSPVKKKPEIIEKPMGPSPLRRSDRSKKHLPEASGSKTLVEVPAPPNIKSKNDDTNERQDPDGGGKRRKRMTAREYRALFKPQRIRIFEADDDKDPDELEKSPQANTSSNRDVDKDLKSPDNKSGCSLEDRDDGCKKHDYDETSLACSKEQRINHDSENQQELDSCDKTRNIGGTSSSKVGGTCKAGVVMENAESNDATILLRNETSSHCEMDSTESICTLCKLGGQLRLCNGVGCNRCYHLSCLDPPVDNLPSGIWHCPLCVKNIKSNVHSVSRVAESIWDTREVELSDAEGLQKQKQYFVKYKGLAHIHNEWVTEAQLIIEAPLLVESFNKNPMMNWSKAWTVPHQLLKKRLLLFFKPLNEGQENAGKALNYRIEWLVKWQDPDYEEATWELETASVLNSSNGQNLIKEYENHKTMDPSVTPPNIPAGGPQCMDQIHLSYVKKLHDSWIKGQSRVVFDFDNQDRMMRVVLFILSLKGVVTQPFLIITTSGSLSQWEAMFLHVAPSNDFKISIENQTTSVRLLGAHKEGGQLVFQVLLYTVDAFVEDLYMLKNINWEAVLVDESQCSEISTHFNDVKSLSVDRMLLLFGGLLGESMGEYLNVLSLLGCNGLSDDSLGKLKENLSHNYVAYECKSDSSKFVEFWVPLQISNVQLEQYCATLLSNAMALRSCKKSDTVGATHDILISNRKCCNHPYIVDPNLQYKITKGLEPTMLLNVGIQASGKLQFLDQILPEVKKRQLRVVILFQPTGGSGRGFASVGDILDDFVLQRFGQDSYERVDGVGIVPAKKQAAINNFNNDMSRFIFLLEHRACLPNVKLSSVDIIFIFDSDLNPANDLRALQKVSFDSKSEQIMIFRLYSSCTLEEKILRLAEHNVAIESKVQRSAYDALLMWGASDLFKRLSEFHSASIEEISSQESFLKDVVEEFVYFISHESRRNATAKPIITRVQSYCNYGKRNLSLLSETKSQLLADGEQPYIFWRKLLEGWYPQWKFVSMSTPRQRKRPHFFVYSSKETTSSDASVVKKRKKTVNNSIEPPTAAATKRHVIQGQTGGTNEGESESSSGDHFWSTAVHNETSLHDLLKPTVSELCEILNFSEDVKILVERLLDFVLENYHVSKEHTSALQAFMISLCWIGSSLSNFEIDRKESFDLAKKHFNFSCMEEEANSAYLKLETAKETFLRHTDNQDCIPAPTEPKEIENFKREWEEKRVQLENDYQVDKALIRTLHSNPSIRSEKLKSLDNEFANKLEEHERLKEVHLKDLKEKMASNYSSSEHETQKMHSEDSKQAAQDSPDKNLIEVPSDNIDVTVPNATVSTVEHDGIDNNVAGVDATVPSVQIEEVPAQQHEVICDDVAGPVDSVELVVPEADSNRSPDGPHVVEERNETGPSDMALHVESAEMGMPAGNCNKENVEDGGISPDTSHAIEDQNDLCGSSCSNSPSAAASQEKTPSVQLFASPASDHSMPTIPEIQNESLQLQQVPQSGIQDKEGTVDPSSLSEIDIDNLQLVEVGQTGLINSEDLPQTAENQSHIPPASGILVETTCEDPVGCSQSVENHANPSDHPMPQSGGNLEEHPLTVAENPLGEHEPHLPSSDAVHEEPCVQNPEASPPPLAAEIPNQNASRLNLPDPLQVEMERLCSAKDHAIRFHEDAKQRLKSECEKEIAEMLAQIRLKYEAKCQDAEAAFHTKTKELDMNLNRVVMNKILAKAFRSKCQEFNPGHAEQVSQAGLTQQLHRFHVPPSTRCSPGIVSSSPAQSSGSQQTTPPPPLPPVQIVHQPAALFSGRLASNTNFRPPASTPEINRVTPNMPTRPPSISEISMSAANLRIHTETRAQSPCIRPLVNSEIRAPAPHMRPSVSSEVRAPAPHLRPFRPSTSGSPDFSTFQRVTTLPPEASIMPSTSAQILPSASPWLPSRSQSPQPPPPRASPQSTPSPSPSPHHPAPTSSLPPSYQTPLPRIRSITTSQTGFFGASPRPESGGPPLPSPPSYQTPLPRIRSITTSQTGLFSASPRPESGGPPLPSPGAARQHRQNHLQPSSELRSVIDLLDLTDFIREESAPSSSGPDLVCLSDDD